MLAHRLRRVSASSPVVVLTFIDGVSATASSTTKTMTHNGGVRTGKWIVAIGTRQGPSGPADPTSVTFCGTALTKLAGQSAASQNNCSIWVSTGDITSDGTDNVVATFSSTQSATRSYLYSVDNLLSTTAADTAAGTADPTTLDLDTTAGGCVVGVSSIGTAGGSNTWSGLTENDDTVVSSYTFSTASASISSSEAPRAVSVDFSGGTNLSACAVSLR